MGNRAHMLTLGVTVLLTACSTDARVARLERRVDSLAVTLTALVNARGGGGPGAPSESVTVALVGAASAGDPHASVVIVEFTDYQCPFCARHFETTLPQIRAEYVNTGKARYIVRDFPITEIHRYAGAAATAARCAAAQGETKYWQYHDSLFTHQEQITDTLFIPLARRIGLNMPAFTACTRSRETIVAVDRDEVDASRAGIRGTPAFVIGRATGDSAKGVLMRGAFPIELFRKAIDGALAAPSVARK